MKLIPICIVGAKVTEISLELPATDSNLPKFQATVVLIDEFQKRVTSITVGNRWSAEPELSLRAIQLIAMLEEEISGIVTRHINKQRRLLTHRKKEAIDV